MMQVRTAMPPSPGTGEGFFIPRDERDPAAVPGG
jgi:hypothetical protein